MERGEVKQFDQPFLLLQEKEGLFYEIVMQTGHVYAQQLMNAAENKFNENTLINHDDTNIANTCDSVDDPKDGDNTNDEVEDGVNTNTSRSEGADLVFDNPAYDYYGSVNDTHL